MSPTQRSQKGFFVPLAYFLVALGILGFISPLPADAHNGYHYAGTTLTAKVANYTSATMTVTAQPSCILSCQAVGWTILWDYGASGAYAEAGVGYDPDAGSTNPSKVALWWASNTNAANGKIVGYVPLGTPVKVEITKNDGQKFATAKWSWPGGMISKQIPTKKWATGPGIHPTKAEIYSTGAHIPFSIQFSNVTVYPQDSATASLMSTSPYNAVGTLSDFSVSYP